MNARTAPPTTATRLERIEARLDEISTRMERHEDMRDMVARHEAEIKGLQRDDETLSDRCTALSNRMWGILVTACTILFGAIVAAVKAAAKAQ